MSYKGEENMSWIAKMKLPNVNLLIDVTYDYKTNSIHVCEVPGYETSNLNKIVHQNQNYVKERLHIHNPKINYYVTYSNSNRYVEDENGNAITSKVKFVDEYNNYYLARLKHLFK
jgi:hypothetical protein